KKAMHSKVPEIKQAATEIYNAAIGKLKEVPAQTLTWGQKAAKNYAKGLESQQHAIEQAASKLAGAVGSYLKVSSPAEKGPMSKAGGSGAWGEKVGAIFAAGLGMTVPSIGAVLGAALAGGIGVPALGAAAAGGSAWEASRGNMAGEVHNHYEVNVTGLVAA